MRIAKYFSLIGILLFVYIVYSIGPFKIAESLSRLDPLLFAVALLFAFLAVLFKAAKQNILMKPFNARLSISVGIKIWLIGFFLSLPTPGKSGDFLRAAYLSRETGVPKGSCLTVVTVERVFDVGYLFIAAISGMAALSIFFGVGQSVTLLLVALFVLFVMAVLVLLKKNATAFILKPFFNRLVPERLKEKLKPSFHDFYQGFGAFKGNKAVLASVSLLTIASWFLAIVSYYFISLALGLPLPYLFLLMVMPVALIVEALPISISGLGTRDATLIFLLSLAGVGAAAAVSFSTAILASNLLVAFFGFVFFQTKKISI